jgi:hypothetical protein
VAVGFIIRDGMESAPPVLDYHGTVQSRMQWLSLRVGVVLLLAFIYSFYAVIMFFKAASDEPFYGHADWSHMFGYVIIPTAALVLCAVCIIAGAILVYLRKLEFGWIALLIWLLFPSLALVMAIEGYLTDIIEMGTWPLAPG